jgi:hypothetical protein
MVAGHRSGRARGNTRAFAGQADPEHTAHQPPPRRPTQQSHALSGDARNSRIAQATGIRAASCVDLTHADVVPMHPIDADGPCGGSAARPVGEPAGTRERRPDPSTARAMSVSLGDLLAEQPARCDSGRAALPFEREPCHITCVRHARRMSDRGEWVYPSARFEPPERGRYQNVQAAGVRGSGT